MQRMLATAALAGVVAGSALSGHAARGRLSAVVCDAFGATPRHGFAARPSGVKVQTPRNEQERARIAGLRKTVRRGGGCPRVTWSTCSTRCRPYGCARWADSVLRRLWELADSAPRTPPCSSTVFRWATRRTPRSMCTPFSLHRLNAVTIDVGRSSRTSGAGSCFGGRAPCTSPPCGDRCASGRRWAPSAIGLRGAVSSFSTPAGQLQLHLDGEKGGQRFSFRLRQRKPARNSSTPRCRNPAMDSDGALVGALHCEMGTPKGDSGEILLDANCPVPSYSMQCKRGSAWTTTRRHYTGGGRGDAAHGSGRRRHNGVQKTNSTQRAIRNIPTADEQTATDNKKVGFRWERHTLCRRIGNGLM